MLYIFLLFSHMQSMNAFLRCLHFLYVQDHPNSMCYVLFANSYTQRARNRNLGRDHGQAAQFRLNNTDYLTALNSSNVNVWLGNNSFLRAEIYFENLFLKLFWQNKCYRLPGLFYTKEERWQNYGFSLGTTTHLPIVFCVCASLWRKYDH